MAIDPSTFDAIDKNNVSLMGRSHAPGMVFGIVKDGEPALITGYGHANLANQEAVTADTVFRIASISKIFTAIGVMQLVEQGKVSLDDPVENYLKSFRIRKAYPDDPSITIRQLLTHTAGIGEYAPLLGYLPPNTFFGVGLKNRPLPPLSRLYRGALRPDRSPGSAWAYANHGFATLGQMIADITGDSFPEAMRKMIFNPLGMNRSDFVRSDRVRPTLADGYWKIFGRVRPVLDFDIITLADGSLFTTANDFAKFLAVISTGGGDLISQESLDLMLRPHFQTDDYLPGMGLGFMLESRKQWYGEPVAAHTGLWLGFHSAMMLSSQHKLGTFAFVNDGGSVGILAAKNSMRQLLLSNLPKPAYQPPDRPDPDPALWPDLIGEYRPLPGFNSNFRLWLTFRLKFEVYVENKQLMIRTRRGPWKNGARLRPASSENPLVFLAGDRHVVFHRDEQGLVERFCTGYFELWKEGNA